MRTARTLLYGVWAVYLTENPLGKEPSRQRAPWTETHWTETHWTETSWTETHRQRPTPDRDPPLWKEWQTSVKTVCNIMILSSTYMLAIKSDQQAHTVSFSFQYHFHFYSLWAWPSVGQYVLHNEINVFTQCPQIKVIEITSNLYLETK